MFKQAKKWRFIDNNPNEEATRPKLTRKKRNFYDNEQVITFLECLEKETIKVSTIITLALYTGIRKGELCALRWSDIDYDKKTLFIDNSLKVVNGIVDEEKAKTEYSVRYVNLGDDILSLLNDYREWQNCYIIEMGEKWIGTDRIFTSINGEHMHPDTPNKLLQKFLKKYDLPKITFHELRHTCASILNSHGIDPKTISEQLGHANIDITLNIYTHSFDDEKKNVPKYLMNYMKNQQVFKAQKPMAQFFGTKRKKERFLTLFKISHGSERGGRTLDLLGMNQSL